MNDAPDYVYAALKELLLTVYRMGIYPTDYEISYHDTGYGGHYSITLKRDPDFESEIRANCAGTSSQTV